MSRKPEDCLEDLLKRYPALESANESIFKAYTLLEASFSNDGTLFTCGNGGSAADAEHIVGELMKEFVVKRKAPDSFKESMRSKYGDEGAFVADKLQRGLRAVSLTGHPALTTAFLNDTEPLLVFAQQLFALGRKGDVLMGLTTSGNSANVLHSFRVASVLGIKTIAMTGMGGGKCQGIVDCCIKVPEKETYKIQELHLPVYHTLCMMIEERFFGDGEKR